MRSSGGKAARLQATLAELVELDVAGLADDEVRDLLPRLLQASNQLSAVTAAVVGSFDARGLCDADACRTTRTWLMAFGRMSQRVAAGWLTQARLMRGLLALAGAAGQGWPRPSRWPWWVGWPTGSGWPSWPVR